MFAIFNKSGNTPVEKERLISYASGFGIIYWLIFGIFVEMLFRPSALFVFVCFIVELTSFSFVSFKKNELIAEFSRSSL